jgi:hypothetical protein
MRIRNILVDRERVIDHYHNSYSEPMLSGEGAGLGCPLCVLIWLIILFFDLVLSRWMSSLSPTAAPFISFGVLIVSFYLLLINR